MNYLKLIIPVIVLAFSGLTARYLLLNPPQAQRRAIPEIPTYVKATKLKLRDYPITIQSQGTVNARTRSTLIPEVSGRIIEVSSAFRDGGFFEKDDILLQIDPSDYETAKVVAEAGLAQAKLAFEQERAQGIQARENWERLGGGEASPLVLREPQLAEAEARVASAQARLDDAARDLERTRIRAPYAGRILRQQVDVGQFVSPGTTMATIYAVDYVEIRLPIANEYIDFLDLPESYRGDSSRHSAAETKVTLAARVGSQDYTWEGDIVRTEGAIDTRSRQLFVVAQVDDPYGKQGDDKPPLKVGQFVKASIQGKDLADVFILPRSAVRAGDMVLTIDGDNRLRRAQIETIWADENNAVFREPLKAGQIVCLTPMAYAADGSKVAAEIDGAKPQMGSGPGSGKGKGKGKGKGGKGKGKGKGAASQEGA